MTALCCAACLHAIAEPDVPILHEGQLFHRAHRPADAAEVAMPAAAPMPAGSGQWAATVPAV